VSATLSFVEQFSATKLCKTRLAKAEVADFYGPTLRTPHLHHLITDLRFWYGKIASGVTLSLISIEGPPKGGNYNPALLIEFPGNSSSCSQNTINNANCEFFAVTSFKKYFPRCRSFESLTQLTNIARFKEIPAIDGNNLDCEFKQNSKVSLLA